MSLNQIELVGGICKCVERQGIKEFSVKQTNAIIAAANDIIRAFDQKFRDAEPNMGLNAWLASDDTGLSSLFMARVLANGPHNQNHYPHDPSDFGRCVRFLRAVPERLPVSAMAACGPVWAALVDRWEEFEKLYERDAPTGKCHELYEEMQKTIKKAGAKW